MYIKVYTLTRKIILKFCNSYCIIYYIAMQRITLIEDYANADFAMQIMQMLFLLCKICKIVLHKTRKIRDNDTHAQHMERREKKPQNQTENSPKSQRP